MCVSEGRRASVEVVRRAAGSAGGFASEDPERPKPLPVPWGEPATAPLASRRGASRLVPLGAYVVAVYGVLVGLALTEHSLVGVVVPAAVAGVALGGAVLVVVFRARLRRPVRPAHARPDARGVAASAVRSLGVLVAQLTPVTVLALVFPSVGGTLGSVHVGGRSLGSIILGGSVVVPLLAQVACAPLYRALGDDLYHRGDGAIVEGFVTRWPGVFVRSLPLVAVVCVPFACVGWSLRALGALALFVGLSLATVQWFVLPIIRRRYGLWAVAWLAYAAALLAAPRLGLLAPLGPLAVLVVATLWRPTPFVLQWRRTAQVGRSFLRGATQGTLIWVNPLVLLLVSGRSFRPTEVFLALLPAVLLFNAYFVLLAPVVQGEFELFQRALHGSPIGSLRARRELLGSRVEAKCLALGLATFVAATASVAIEALAPAVDSAFSSALICTSIGFCLESILVYDLAQLRRDGLSFGLSGLHVAGFVVALVLVSPTTGFYAVNAALEVPILGLLATAYAREIAEPEYTLFWGRAAAW